jgi:hypothetical protein
MDVVIKVVFMPRKELRLWDGLERNSLSLELSSALGFSLSQSCPAG